MPEPEPPPLVTMAAEHGAGGDEVAPRVAEALGVPFLDRALPADPEAPHERPGSVVSSLARASSMLAGAPIERLDLAEGGLRAELEAFLSRARHTGGVVLGRGAMVALAGQPGVLHVLLTGPEDRRVARVAERHGIGPEEARRRARDHDRARREYVRRTYGLDSDDRTLYHLVVDTLTLGADTAVELVVTATRALPPPTAQRS